MVKDLKGCAECIDCYEKQKDYLRANLNNDRSFG